jgi:L-alanine-DL-glutamate epimerase-like enolase superfamily enzyme
MRIVGVRTARLEVPGQENLVTGEPSVVGFLHVAVDTDEGLVGESIVFAFDPRHLDVYRAMVSFLGQQVAGDDPTSTERIWQKLLAAAGPFGRSGVSMVGVSAIDRACWSLAAQSAVRPIHQLLGVVRDTVPAYGSGLWLSRTVDQLIADAADMLRAGFRGIKMRIGKAHLEEDVERVRAVRAAIGPDIALMVDANKRLTVDHAVRLGRRLEQFELAWFEEPVQAHDLAGSARVAAALDTPIASGESEYTRSGFRAILEARAADILMPDISRIGGVTEMMRVARLAEAYDVPVTPHHYAYECIQVLAAVANGTWLEVVPWFSTIYRDQLQIVDGRVAVPNSTGGFDLDPVAIERYRVD